jgi:BirA family biotin operon repressor/biotin-[acetyl-CoA-carboxylase] ligase
VWCRFEPVTGSCVSVSLDAGREIPEFGVVLADLQTDPRPGWWEPGPATALEAAVRLHHVPLARFPLIVLAGALAVWRALADLGLEPELLWPSEVRVDGRVVAGVRAERRGDGPVALGLGVYVTLRKDQIPGSQRDRVTSLGIVGASADRIEVLFRFLDHLEPVYQEVQRDPEAMLAAYRRACSTLGRRVRAEDLGVEALAVAIDGNGHLALETGERLTGPVTVLPGPGRDFAALRRSLLRVGLSVTGVVVASVSGVFGAKRLRRSVAAAG